MLCGLLEEEQCLRQYLKIASKNSAYCRIALMTVLWVKVAQLCLTLCDPKDYTVHRILQARILEWVAFLFFRGSYQARNQTRVSCIAGRFFTNWAILRIATERYVYWAVNLIFKQVYGFSQLNKTVGQFDGRKKWRTFQVSNFTKCIYSALNYLFNQINQNYL